MTNLADASPRIDLVPVDRDRLRRRALRLAENGRQAEADRVVASYVTQVAPPLDDFEVECLERAQQQESGARRAIIALDRAIDDNHDRAYPMAVRAIKDFGSDPALQRRAAAVAPTPERRLHHLRRAHTGAPHDATTATTLIDALVDAGEQAEARLVAARANVYDTRLAAFEAAEIESRNQLREAHEVDPTDVAAGRRYVEALYASGDSIAARRVLGRYAHRLTGDLRPTYLERSLHPAKIAAPASFFQNLVAGPTP